MRTFISAHSDNHTQRPPTIERTSTTSGVTTAKVTGVGWDVVSYSVALVIKVKGETERGHWNAEVGINPDGSLRTLASAEGPDVRIAAWAAVNRYVEQHRGEIESLLAARPQGSSMGQDS
jgi:hypothetical protein